MEIECHFSFEGYIVVCYNDNKEKRMVGRVKNICKTMEAWEKMHSEKGYSNSGGLQHGETGIEMRLER